MNKRAVQFVSALAHFADWTAADISLRPNAVMMNGFTICSVTDSMFLNVFRKIPPQRIEITKVLPSNTALFLFYGIGNYNAYREYYYKYLESAHRRSSVDAALKKINEKYKIDVEKSLTSWINNEVVYGILEPALQEIDENSFAAIRSNNIEYAEEQLKSLVDSVNKMSESGVDTENYNGHIIRYLDIPDALPQLLGKDFSTLHQHYFCTIKDYIFFANTSSTLKKIIQSIETEKTLSNNENYKQFTEKIAEEANVYLYTNIARSAGIYSNFTALTYSGEILQNIDNFRKFEAFAFQFSSNQDMFYSNFYLKHNPVYKRDPSSLWETKLDTTVSSAPVIVSNHTNDTKEILVQDDANALYLISNTGKVLWKKELPEKIKSSIYQIDAYKNEKLQYLFNTTEAIYLLDRNGKDCKGYPVKLKSPATNALTVYDYDNNHDYRFFIACDKKIYSYKKDGKLNEKWKFDKSKETIHAPVQYAVVDGKDYLIAIDNKGKTYLANRQGELRLKLRETFNVPVKDFFVDEGNSPENTWMIVCDSLGNVLRLSFSDVLENQKLKKFAHPPYFDYQDLDGKSDHKKEYIFLEPEQLSVYSQDKNLLFTYALNNAVAGPPQYFYFPDKKGKIGLSSNKEIVMLDHNGTVCPGFPLYGIAPFCIYDINGDKLLNVIVAGEKGVIYAYTIE